MASKNILKVLNKHISLNKLLRYHNHILGTFLDALAETFEYGLCIPINFYINTKWAGMQVLGSELFREYSESLLRISMKRLSEYNNTFPQISRLMLWICNVDWNSRSLNFLRIFWKCLEKILKILHDYNQNFHWIFWVYLEKAFNELDVTFHLCS